MNIILNVGNDVTHKHAKSDYEILCIVDYTKINTKSEKNYRFENVHTQISMFFIFM
jgi:hypothetical protein